MPAGMEAGLREVADAAGVPLILYLKSEDGFGSAREAGLDAVGRLMDDGVAVAIKYAVVRDDPGQDAYLDGLLRRVDRTRVISGMGERPAIEHLRDFEPERLHHRFRVHRASLLQRAARRVSGRQVGRGGDDSRAASCRSRICATPGGRRACCTTRRSWPASRRRDRFRRSSRRSAPPSSIASRPWPQALAGVARMSRPRRTPSDLRSYRWFGKDDLRSFGHRSRAKQAGFSLDDITGKPVIAILNTWSDANPCHTHFRVRAEEVKRGIWQAGGFPMEIPVMTLGETFMKPSTMLYRNLLAMEAEEALRSYPADGVVLMGGCDKTVPALVMGATSANLPAIMVPAGPMLRGNWRGQILGSGSDVWKYWTERRAGTLDECSWREMEDGIARSYGTCMTMGTASTMGAAVDALGPDAAGRVVDSRGRFRASPHGHRRRPAHRRDGLGGRAAARHPDHRGVRERRDGGDGARRIDQRHHSSDRDGRPRRRGAGPRSVRPPVAADAVPGQHPPVGKVPDGGLLLRRRAARRSCAGWATCCTPTA